MSAKRKPKPQATKRSKPRPLRQHVPGPDVTNIRSSQQAKRGVVPIPKRRT